MSAYSDAVEALSPTAYWRLGEVSGVTAYDETTDHNGTYVNTPTLDEPSLIVSDSANAAVLFASASTEHVTVADHDDLDLGATFTIIAWVKFTANRQYPTIVGKYDASPARGFMFMVGYGSDRKARLWTKPTGGATSTIGTTLLNDGAIHMVVATLSGGEGNIYVDGGAAEGTNGSMSTPGDNSDPLEIALCDEASYDRRYDGTSDEITIIKGDALTQSEIQNLYDIATAIQTTVFKCGGTEVRFGYNATTMKLLYAECLADPPAGCEVTFKAVEFEGSTWEDAFTEAGSIVCPYDMEYESDGEGGIKNIDISLQLGRE